MKKIQKIDSKPFSMNKSKGVPIRHIIAVGGGGFGRNPKHNKIEKYILEQARKEKPKVLFLPTASAEDNGYIVNFYACFSKLNCEPSHINLFERTPRLDSLFNQADVIYVGGGNTKSMLAVWREWKIDKLLKKAYNRGVVLAGVSAGAICWFEQGITDSWVNNLNVLECLGFLPGMACPHYLEEKDRKSSVHDFLENEKSQAGYCIDGGAAVHFINEVYDKTLSFYLHKNAFYVEKKNGKIIESVLASTRIS